MIQDLTVIQEILGEAEKEGEFREPSKLMEVVRSFNDDDTVLGTEASLNAMFDSLEQEFRFINLHGFSSLELSQKERSTWAALMRWLTRELRTWSDAGGAGLHYLSALLVLAQYGGMIDRTGTRISHEIARNRFLLDSLRVLLGRFAVDIVRPRNVGYLQWEQRVLESIEKAECSQDWELLSENWHHTEQAWVPNFLQEQIVRCLAALDLDGLVLGVADAQSMARVWACVSPLPLRERFRLGILTENKLVRFACVYSALDMAWFDAAVDVDAEVTELLSQLLAFVTEDEREWDKWMAVFNRYPVRFPKIQQALGRALATGSESAILFYVNSIALNKGEARDRELVATCLREFVRCASSTQRGIMWRAAYERWCKWDFCSSELQEYLFSVSRCSLDFAIVGYCVECLDDADRLFHQESAIQEWREVGLRWHVSMSDCITAANRAISRLQPYFHASIIAKKNGDWLAAAYYEPQELSANRYTKIRWKDV